jgi:Bacterial Ig-like domain (group 3)/Abnormal spindle-like microcephaly-assoc'd, ASPM-SPD-2-Hydin
MCEANKSIVRRVFNNFNAASLSALFCLSLTAVFSAAAAAQTPQIKSISAITTQQFQTIYISGSNFGERQDYNGDSVYISFQDVTGNWEAGYDGCYFHGCTDNLTTLIVDSWQNGEVVLGGFLGAWPVLGGTFSKGHTIQFCLWNPQSGDGPACINTTAEGVLTTVKLSSSPNPSKSGGPVTLTATVNSTFDVPPPNGESVTFMQGTTGLGTASISGGVAQLSTSTLPAGIDVIAAEYGGDANFESSTSKSVKQVVETQAPYGVVSPTSVNFGQEVVGQTSSSRSVSLKNTGESELTFSDISISGDFSITVNDCEKGAKPQTHCNVYVTFTPQAIGTETGTLTFVDNALNSPQTVALTGTGTN